VKCYVFKSFKSCEGQSIATKKFNSFVITHLALEATARGCEGRNLNSFSFRLLPYQQKVQDFNYYSVLKNSMFLL
jgi:hypothetical protein